MKINGKKKQKEYSAPKAEYLDFTLSDVMATSFVDVLGSDVFDDDYTPSVL